jgi:hypothetical protein
MAKKKLVSSEPKRATRTCQISADVVYWLSLIVSLEDQKSINDIVDPMLRAFARERLKSHSIDPDVAWEKAQG